MPGNYHEFYAAHVAEIQSRWEAALVAESHDRVVVHSGTPLYSFQDDYEYAFRPNPHFLAWLPLTHHPDSVLVVEGGKRPQLFYYQPDDYWHLPPADPEAWWADHFDVKIVTSPDEWREAIGPVDSGTVALGDSPALCELLDSGHINPIGLTHRLQLARTRKTPYEIACMERASQLAAQAHTAAEQAFRESCSEYEIHMSYLRACKHTDTELPYNNIVALNAHGAVLHYQARERQAPAESLSFLIDAGCTVNAYASDITRTYAREAGEFHDLVLAMDAMQLDLMNAIRAGVDYKALHVETHHRVAAILAEAGIIRVNADTAVESGLSSVFFPHGVGHYIGLQTHDVAGLVDDEGEDIPRPEGHPFLRLTRKLDTGNVLTIEPGLYFIEPLLRAWKEQGDAAAIDWEAVERLKPYGGIRIEDNVVVLEDGHRNLTREAFAGL